MVVFSLPKVATEHLEWALSEASQAMTVKIHMAFKVLKVKSN